MFPSVLDACLWALETFGQFDRSLEIDRIDNDGHYEPGNLRLSTRAQNLAHTRKSMISCKIHKFRQEYPDVVYSERALSDFFRRGMTNSDIIERMNAGSRRNPRKTRKDKRRECTTSSTPDPFIVSLCKDA